VQPEETLDDEVTCFNVAAGKPGFVLPMRQVELDGQHSLSMRVDSGSMVSILPKSVVPSRYMSALRSPPCQLSPVGSQQIHPLGVFHAVVSYKGKATEEMLFVVDDANNDVPALLGESVSIRLGLLDATIAGMSMKQEEEAATSAPAALPAMRGPITVQLDPECPPVQQPARRVPPALLPVLRDQLDAWLAQGVVEMVDEVQPGDFVSPLVAVPKPDKSVRWCIDLRCVNQAVKRPGIQLPTTDDLLSQLSDARVFSKLDLKSGYSQLEITPDCRHAFVVASPLGSFRFCRLPFGVSSGPELFQRKMEQILAGIDGVLIYLDDILVFAATQEEHDRRLDLVRSALDKYGVTLNDKKCLVSVSELTFLGHEVSSSGIRPSADKIEALCNMPDPSNVSELRSFLGLVSFLQKFIPSLANTVAPLTQLLSSDWNWTAECAKAAAAVRSYLQTDPVLALFDPARPTRIEVDASGYGLGAVLLQQVPASDGSDACWKPVYFASRKLSDPESRYATIEREALAVVWGVQRFRSFITGLEFSVVSDHKPLIQVFKAGYNLASASVRVQRLVLKIQDLSFSVSYRPGEQNVLADFLSRLPTGEPDVNCVIVQHVCQKDGLSSRYRREVGRKTKEDVTLCEVRKALRADTWSSSAALAPYRGLKDELSVWHIPDSEDFFILRGERLVIPQACTSEVLRMAHDGHPGLERTRARLSS